MQGLSVHGLTHEDIHAANCTQCRCAAPCRASAGSIRLAHPIFLRCLTEICWSEAKTQDLANVLWALSRVAYPVPESLLQDLEKRSTGGSGCPAPTVGLPIVELVACLSALAEVRNVSSGLWKSVKTLDTSTLGTRALGTLLWAHATAQVIPPTSLVKKLDVSKMSPQSLANSLWALAKLQLIELSSKNLTASQKSLATQNFKAQEFASCVWAIGSMEKPALNFFEDLQLPNLSDFEDHHLSQASRDTKVFESLKSSTHTHSAFAPIPLRLLS